MSKVIKFAYFGGEPLGVPVLEKLVEARLVPELVVCNPDRPVGRKQILTAPPVKQWSEAEGLNTVQPSSYKTKEGLEILTEEDWDLFVVVAYSFILPKWLLDIPKKGVLNVHPSMLPKLRGASPIRTAIKDGLRDDIGVTVMLLDEEMDHGPILDQIHVSVPDNEWPVAGPELDKLLAQTGGELLSEVIPAWINDEIAPQEQNHELATYCGKLMKEDSELLLDPNSLPSGQTALEALQKIRAFAGIGDTFFRHEGKRIKIKSAEIDETGTLKILKIVPEGRSEMEFFEYISK